MSYFDKFNLDYAAVFAALGKFIARQKLADVCVMEFESGLIVTGTILYETSEVLNRRTETHVFSGDDLKKMVKGG